MVIERREERGRWKGGEKMVTERRLEQKEQKVFPFHIPFI